MLSVQALHHVLADTHPSVVQAAAVSENAGHAQGEITERQHRGPEPDCKTPRRGLWKNAASFLCQA